MCMQKATTTTNGMGACHSMGGVLLSKQGGDGGAPYTSLSTSKMSLTVTRLDQAGGIILSNNFNEILTRLVFYLQKLMGSR